MSTPPLDSDSHEEQAPMVIYATAKGDFETALRKGYWRSVMNWFARTDNQLLPFDEIRAKLPVSGQHEIGMQQIELDKIIGSVGRYMDFDRAFLPRRTNTRRRWESVDRAVLQDIVLPPIEVYKVGSVYFVKDGNHRVSVARERGQAFIDAYVTEIDVPFEVDEHSQIDQIIREIEQARFDDKTAIQKIRPGAEIHFTVPGGPDKVLEHIRVHQWFMGEKRKKAVPFEEAVAEWYDEVYQPLIRVIHHLGIMDGFPGRSDADLYLWIIEHLHYLREEYHAEVTLEDAASHFAEVFRKSRFERFIRFFRRLALRGASNDDLTLPHP